MSMLEISSIDSSEILFWMPENLNGKVNLDSIGISMIMILLSDNVLEHSLMVMNIKVLTDVWLSHL